MNARLPLVRYLSGRSWSVGLAALQLVAFWTLVATATSPALHEALFHPNAEHAPVGAEANESGCTDDVPSEERPGHVCDLCVWSQGGFTAEPAVDFRMPAPVASETALAAVTGARTAPRSFASGPNTIRGPPELNS